MRDYGFLFLLIPLFGVALFLWLFREERRGGLLHSGRGFILKTPLSLRASLSFLPLILKLIALALVILALARPQQINERSRRNVEGIDIMIVLDISLSMLVEDMGPQVTRLRAAKSVVSDFIKGRVSDRIGLIVFSGESYTRVPLTLDYNLLLKDLSRVQTAGANQIKPGTAVGVALANASARLRHSPLKSRVMIFLTDGDNNAGSLDPLTALQVVQGENIKVYTIGLGRVSGRSPIRYPVVDSFGRKTTRIMYVQTKVNEQLIQRMARNTGGKSFMARDLSGLKAIFAEIDGLEKQNIKVSEWTEHHEKFPQFLKSGILLYGLALALSLTVFFRGV